MPAITKLPEHEFEIIEDVPILDEHEIRLPVTKEGKTVGFEIVKVDKKKLQEIADNGNRRIEETCDYAPLVIGHTDKDKTENQQPEVVGFADKYEVKKLARTNRWCIHCRFLFKRDKSEKAKNYPRRSVELWPGRWEIDPISLLGATTPQRDLGTLHYDRDGHNPIRYSREFGDQMVPEAMDKSKQEAKPEKAGDDALVEKVIKALEQTDVWQWAKQQMQGGGAEGAGDAPMPGGEGEGDPMEGMSEEELMQFLDSLDGQEPLKMEGGAPAMPGGGNTFVPGREEEKKQMSRDEEVIQYQRFAEDLASQLTSLQIKYQRSEREKDLITLETEGVMLDRVAELDELQSLPDAQYKTRLSKIKKHYQRAPVGRGGSLHTAHITTPSASTSGRGRTQTEMNTIIQYARENGLTYEQAIAKVEGERVL